MPVSGLVSYGFIDGAFEHRPDGTSCAVVHTVVELEVADRELGVVEVIVKRIEVRLVETTVLGKLGVEPLERFEIPSLVGVIERLAEIGVPQVGSHGRTGGKSHGQDESEQLVWRSHCRLPISERDRSLAGIRSSQRQSHELGLRFLAEGKVFRVAEVFAALTLAVDEHLELVLPGRHVADVDPLNAALAEAARRRGASGRPRPAR
jgi:hypothetical protein